MRFFILACLVSTCLPGVTQIHKPQAHSHNDYEQSWPFHAAWKESFGSIEADLFLIDGVLVVGHDTRQASRGWKFDSLYLSPLAARIAENHGFVYADTTRPLQLMLDLKSAAAPALHALIRLMNGYPALLNCPTLRIVISGNRPLPADFVNWPSWLYFDGESGVQYTDAQLSRVAMISENFRKYSRWNGNGQLPDPDRQLLQQVIDSANISGKPVRFWNAPDTTAAWHCLIAIGVGFINTDRIEALSLFLRER